MEKKRGFRREEAKWTRPGKLNRNPLKVARTTSVPSASEERKKELHEALHPGQIVDNQIYLTDCGKSCRARRVRLEHLVTTVPAAKRYWEARHLSHLNRRLIKSPLKLTAAVHKELNQRTAGHRLILFPIKQVLQQRWLLSKSKPFTLNTHNRYTQAGLACETIHIQKESRP